MSAGIRLGLERIAALVDAKTIPWRAVHVAGTNGKGSTCAYLSAILRQTSRLRIAQFSTPHLIDRWDSITIDGKPVSQTTFETVEARVKSKPLDPSIGPASQFEVLTAAAFEIFTQEHVDLAIIECGMGGRLDATNILQSSALSIITRIGLDHQAFLGDTLKQIAFEKAGILKAGSVAVVDGSSDEEAVQEIERVAANIKVPVIRVPEGHVSWTESQQIWLEHGRGVLRDMERQGTISKVHENNFIVALHAYVVLKKLLHIADCDAERVRLVIREAIEQGPSGRSSLTTFSVNGKTITALVDGAHNPQAWQALYEDVNLRLRHNQRPVTWLIACTQGKDAQSMFGSIPDTDTVVLTQFGAVDGMPWVKAMPADSILPDRLARLPSRTLVEANAARALEKLTAMQGPFVIAGSLYLVSDVLRLRQTLASAGV